MNIKDKLSRLDTQATLPQPSLPAGEDWIAQAESELQVKIIRQVPSFFLLKETYHPIHSDPHYLILQKEGFRCRKFHLITATDPHIDLNLKKVIFLDLETTGLAGGTGTYAFLVGLGHIELDHIVVRQYLLPDFNHEWLMLKFIDQALHPFKITVSFNGKTFDLPVLQNRFLLNRITSLLEDMYHVDLLHSARRIWKLRLPACDLQTLEKHVLNLTRHQDIPGHLIPQIYFEFIRRREAILLRDVLEHNFFDIVNMILLTIRIAAIVEEPHIHLRHPEDLYTLANYYYQNKHYLEALELLETILSASQIHEQELETRAYLLLSMIHKKMHNPDQSKKYLWQLIERQYFHPMVIEELAKFYEHQDRDFTTALEIVEKGIRYLNTLGHLIDGTPQLNYLPGLLHRKRRLLRKIGKRDKR